jgi:hypothetical protein
MPNQLICKKKYKLTNWLAIANIENPDNIGEDKANKRKLPGGPAAKRGEPLFFGLLF